MKKLKYIKPYDPVLLVIALIVIAFAGCSRVVDITEPEPVVMSSAAPTSAQPPSTTPAAPTTPTTTPGANCEPQSVRTRAINFTPGDAFREFPRFVQIQVTTPEGWGVQCEPIALSVYDFHAPHNRLATSDPVRFGPNETKMLRLEIPCGGGRVQLDLHTGAPAPGAAFHLGNHIKAWYGRSIGCPDPTPSPRPTPQPTPTPQPSPTPHPCDDPEECPQPSPSPTPHPSPSPCHGGNDVPCPSPSPID